MTRNSYLGMDETDSSHVHPDAIQQLSEMKEAQSKTPCLRRSKSTRLNLENS